MGHVLEFFSADCPLCQSFLTEVEVGKCAGCELKVHDVRDPASKPSMSRYHVRVAPTLVIDGKIKVEGRIAEPWMCGEEFYAMLLQRYPLINAAFRPSSS